MKAFYKKNLLLLLGNLLPATILIAQDSGTATENQASSQLSADVMLLWLLASTMFLVIIFTLMYVLYSLVRLNKTLYRNVNDEETPSFSFTAAVPLEKEHEILLDHDYDGIKELDNQLPPWWVALFYLTLAFGAIYWWYYHVRGDGNIQEQEYLTELIEAEAQMKLMANKVDENSVKLLSEPERIKSGEGIFQKNCVACHGKLGEGGVGPNLTDAYWLHGGDIQSIFKTIKYGVPTKGMIPWQAQLSPLQIQEVASYINTFKGTHPPNGKEPQGELLH